MAGYTGGRIKRIRIRNFMTYDDVEIIPKSGLNLIVGLNGSGKSSIMCAICLGLAGKPQFTGRATQLSDFIKHGQHQADIEIELECVRERNIVISRKLKGDKCEWHLNKRASNLNEVTTAVKKFNIDTSNLCQFLPQEKVVEFSRMDKKQRLENMLQAIGEPRLFQLFNELKNLYRKCSEIEIHVKQSEQSKCSAEERNERISDEVLKQENRVRLKKELEDLFNIQIVLQYRAKKIEVQRLKEEIDSLKQELGIKRREQDTAVESENYIFKEYQTQAEELLKSKSSVRDLTNRLNEKYNTVSTLNEQADNAKIEYKNRLAEKETQKKRLQDINIQIEGLERLLEEEMRKKRNIDENMLSNSHALSQLQQDVSELYQNIENASAEKNCTSYTAQSYKTQLASLKDDYSKKLTNLKKYDKYTYEAVMWLNENKDRFKSNIYLPIMLEVNVHTKEHCKYVENHIAARDMYAFVCEDKEDCKRLTEILKIQKKLPVNIVMAPDTPLSNFRSPAMPRDFQNWGLECFLIDLFTAPEPVMRYLCACYYVHNIPVATSNIDGSKIETILQRFRVFYADNVKVSGKRSRYGDRNWSVKKDFISNRNLLVNHDDAALRELEQKVQVMESKLQEQNRKCEDLRSELAEKEKIQEKLRQERKHLQDYQKQIVNINTKLSMKRNYRKQMSVVINEEEEKTKVTQKVQFVNGEKEKLFYDINKLFKDLYCLQREAIKRTLCMNCLSKELKMTRAANEEIHDKVKALEQKVEELRNAKHAKMIPAKQLVQEIKRKNINLSPLTLERTLDENEEKISHVQAQLNLNEDNEPLINEFNARKQQIEAIQSDINDLLISLEQLKRTIEEKRQEWLEPLEGHISNINQKFSRYFKHLSCAGEISLDIPDNINDFANYGLQIKLKFHNDQPMTELSQTHHSGGECSVAAIVFILSLQELTEVPFRCIDEINQGMDSIYERKIYQLISDSVGDDRCSQYFLLTPKLLMDLKYPDDVAVHVIYNSCFLNVKLDIKKLLEVAESS